MRPSSAAAHAGSKSSEPDSSDQLEQFRQELREPAAGVRIVRQQAEVGEVEAGTDRAGDERVETPRARRLPGAGRDDGGGDARSGERAELDALHGAGAGLEHEELERLALEEGPLLVRAHLVPAAVGAAREEEVDRGQGRALAATEIGRAHV